jgi:uncharacterized phage infection (PIP) family protein YhgE
MAESFRPLFDALKQTAEGVVQAMEGVKKMADAALHAQDEHEDLRETVARLESLVISQGDDLRAMRDRLDRGDR